MKPDPIREWLNLGADEILRRDAEQRRRECAELLAQLGLEAVWIDGVLRFRDTRKDDTT